MEDLIAAHHTERLTVVASVLDRTPRTAWEISSSVFAHIVRAQHMFAVTETLSHLERLVALGRAERLEGSPVRFTA